MSQRQLKPLSEAVRRNWELWCEASFAKRARSDLMDWQVGSCVGFGVCGAAIAGMVGLMTESYIVAIALYSVAIVIGAGILIERTRHFYRRGVIPENVQNLRLGDIRAASLHQLKVYMVELQKKLLDRPRWDAAFYVKNEKELLLEEHLDRYESQLEALEQSFQTHGDLGSLLDPGQIEELGTKAIAKIQATERDADARRLAVAEVERTLRGTS